MTIQMETQDEKTTLYIRGRFDFSAHSEFRQCSEQALALPDTRKIEVNLREVDYLDSSALGMLLLLREKAQNTGKREVTLTGSRGLVQQVLDVANFGRLFKIN